MSTAPVPSSLDVHPLGVPHRGLEALKVKIAHNLKLGVVPFAKRSVEFAASELRSRIAFRSAARLGVGVRIVGRPLKLTNNGGVLVIEDDVVFAAPVTSIFLDLLPGAQLTIGAQTYFNDAVWVGCTGRISIGRRVLIGPGVRLIDNAYHGTYQRRVMPVSRPIVIEDDVWIASDSIILPGVTVGRGSIIGAHSVVLRDVPPFTIVAGNPAKQVQSLNPAAFPSAA